MKLFSIFIGSIFLMACSSAEFNGSGHNFSSEPVSVHYDQPSTASQVSNTSNPAAPDYAVTQGSFSVWTEPKDPQPFQSYVIVINVIYSSNQLAITPQDLTGIVLGSDGYTQPIHSQDLYGATQFTRTPLGQEVRVSIPGGGNMVRDLIDVQSKNLAERQKIQIEF